MDKHVTQGVKKLFSLTKTKIRLAREAGTLTVKPDPLPIVRLFSQVQLHTIDDCESFLASLKSTLDWAEPSSLAKATIQLCDIIEGVKWGFEGPEGFSLIGSDGFKKIEAECKVNDLGLNIFLLSNDIPDGVTLFIGDNPPDGVHHLGLFISNIGAFMDFAYSSGYFFTGSHLRNIVARSSGGNSLASAVAFAVNELSIH